MGVVLGVFGGQVFSELLLRKITLNVIKQTPKLNLRKVIWHVLKHHVHGSCSLATKEVVTVSMKYLYLLVLYCLPEN